MRAVLTFIAFTFFSTVALAQQVSPEGNWRDEYGTSFHITLCGDGTQLCATLTDVQGESRTEANLAYVNQQVMQAAQTAPNVWEGMVIFDGQEAKGKVTLTGANTMEIEGCRGILCSTLVFARV